MTIATEAPRQSRPELSLDPIIVGLGLVVLALWRARARVAGDRRRRETLEAECGRAIRNARDHIVELLEASQTLAAHTRRLSDELFRAEAELQREVGLDVDPQLRLDPVWNDLYCENGPLNGPLTASEDPPTGIDPESRTPDEEPAA